MGEQDRVGDRGEHLVVEHGEEGIVEAGERREPHRVGPDERGARLAHALGGGARRELRGSAVGRCSHRVDRGAVEYRFDDEPAVGSVRLEHRLEGCVGGEARERQR